MARIKKFAGDIPQGLSGIDTFLVDNNPNSEYFRVTDFKDTFTGGKNGFLIEGSEYLKETTEVKIEILDVEGNTIYFEPGDGIPEYYEGISKVVSVHIYEDTPIGIAKITILGELKQYLDEGGVLRDIPEEWKGLYNVKWEREFKINKNLTNEDKVRFYRRPDVAITEIARPIFTANPISVTQTGNVLGTPIVPAPGTNIDTFPRPSQYLLTTLDDTRWTGSVINSPITVGGQVLDPLEVVSDTELVVSTPYTENSIVTAFNNKPYSTTFNYIKNDEGLGTALSGSFGKFIITNLETFVGDVHRIKVFRTSQADLTDFQFVQEIVLESTEILIDYEQSQRDEESYGLFTPYILDEYWELSSANITKEFNQSFLFNSVKLDSIGENTFNTKGNVEISNEIEYTLSFNVRIPEVVSGDNIEVYLQGTKNGTQITQSIGSIESNGNLLQKVNQEFNFIARDFDNAKLYFKVKGQNWYISTVSLRAAQESSFSPDEITFIQTVPRTLEQETFDFRFEFYDINNNYIPVLVTATKTFTEGNLNEIKKNIEIIPTQLYFQFDSGSQQGNAVPPKSLFFNINKEFLTGSTTWTSGAYDNENNLLDPAEYALQPEEFYPGLLEDVSTDSVEKYRLTVESFSGSIYENVVQYIEYTAECEGVTDNVTISRLVDGKGGVNFEIRPYRGTIIRNSNTASSVEIQAIRIDGINEVNLQAGLPLDYSIPQLYITSESVEGDVSYITLAEASSSGFVEGLVAGSTGSGEINYNAEFNRDAIDGQTTVYLIPSTSPTSESILTSLTLTDIQDGLDRGIIKYNTDTFGVNPYVSFANTSLDRTFTPATASITGSFLRRGQTENPISGTLQIYPTMSFNDDFNPSFWLYYVTGPFDNDVTFSIVDENENVIQSSNGVTFEGTRDEHKQLTVTFTYTEPFTTSSVSIDQTFTIVPEGKPGDDSINIELDPRVVTLDASETRVVEDYTPTVTNIRVKQGNGEGEDRYLTFQQDKEPGTFFLTDATPTNITFGGIADGLGTTTLLTEEAEDMTESPNVKRATIVYDLEIRPYFTSSYYTASVSQSFVRVDEGAAGRTVSLTANTNTVIYNGEGNLVSPSDGVILTATSTNTTGSNYFYFYRGDSFIGEVFNNSTTVTRNIDVDTLPGPNESQTFRVELHDGNQNRGVQPYVEDALSINGVQDGSVTYTSQVTNQNAAAFVDVYGDLSLDNTGTEIRAFKGDTELTAVTSFSEPNFDPFNPDDDDFDPQGNPIPNGEYIVTIKSVPSYFDLAGSLTAGSTVPVVSGVATIGDLDDWTNFIDGNEVPQNSSGQIVYTIQFEDPANTVDVVQNISLQYEGRIGPGIIMRGEWTGDLEYQFSVPQKRRDAVFRNISDNVHYWAMTSQSFAAQRGSAPYTDEPEYLPADPDWGPGFIDDFGWQYLGVQDFFVAAKIAIFEESFVENTINVGNIFGNDFANIVIAGGRPDPYIAVGQTGTQGESGVQYDVNGTIYPTVIGYNAPGVFMGVNNGTTGTSGTTRYPMFSLVSLSDDKYLRWDGYNLEINANNFSVTKEGDVDVRGTIFAESGSFEGGVVIEPGGSIQVGGDDFVISNDDVIGPQIIYRNETDPTNSNKDYFRLNSDGLFLSGSIQATSGLIGGFDIRTRTLESVDDVFRIIGSSVIDSTTGHGLVIKDSLSKDKIRITNQLSLTSVAGGFTPPSFAGDLVAVSEPGFTTRFSGTQAGTTSILFNDSTVRVSDDNPPNTTPENIVQLSNSTGQNITGDVTLVLSADTYNWTSTISLGSPAPDGVAYQSVLLRYRVELYEKIAGTGGSWTIIKTQTASDSVGNAYIPAPFTLTTSDDINVLMEDVTFQNGYIYALRVEIYDVDYDCYFYGNKTTSVVNTLNYNYRVPEIIAADVNVTFASNPSDTFVEITDGGFQVVAGTGKFLKVPAGGDGSGFTTTAGGSLSVTENLGVTGSIEAQGNITAFASSDRKLKDDITPILQPLEKINQIGGYSFVWNENQKDFKGFDYGVVAQEILQIAPELVKRKVDGYYGVKYEKLIPFLIEAVKELSNKVEKLESKNKE